MALTLSSAQPSVTEGGALTFTVAATAGDDQKLVKHLSWVILDASDNVVTSGDFAAASGELSPITPGKTSRDFTITPVADALFEGAAETYTVQVRSDSVAGVLLSGALEVSATFTVEDGDAPPVYSITDALPVTEGGALAFAVTTPAASTGPQTVWYTVDGGEVQTLAIPAGAAAAEIRVQTQDNAVHGDNPAVAVELVSASLGTASGTATGAVTDNEAAPAYSIADAAPVAEGGALAFAVTATAASTADQTVRYRVDGGEVQTLAIPAGETAAEVRVQTQDNAVHGDNPAVAVELVSASLGTASGTATGAVTDNDGVSVYSVSAAGTAAVAEGGALVLTVARTGGLGAEAVTYTLGGAAIAGSDYAAPSGSVAFQPGELVKTARVQTYLDTVHESDETVVLNLVAASDGGSFDGASAIGTVTDLDLAGALRRQVAVEAGPDGNVSPSADVLRFGDGWTALDGRTDLGSALRLYQATLGREPDPIGLGFWTGALETGTLSLPEVAQGFVASPEFQARYGVPDNAGFVDLLYRNVLGRAGEAEGMAHWTGALDAGAITRAGVVLGFSESAELVESTAGLFSGGVWVPAAGRFSDGVWAADPVAVDVMRYYETVLDRLPDAGGLLYWIDVREHGLTLPQMADAFTGSAEFGARYGALSNEGFVEQLYLNSLDRPGEGEGLAHWIGALDAGALSRAEVVAGFAFSLEMTTKLTPLAADGVVFV